MSALQVQIGIIASNSNEVNMTAKVFKYYVFIIKLNAILLRVQILRLNGLTLAALGQTQVSLSTPIS